jgi:hypothetical protein
MNGTPRFGVPRFPSAGRWDARQTRGSTSRGTRPTGWRCCGRCGACSSRAASFFARLVSSDGVEGFAEHLGGRRYRLPGGVEWLLSDERMLRGVTDALRSELLDPLKTVVVHGARSMSVWCVRKK